MDILKIFLIVFCWVFVAGLPATNPTDDIPQEKLKELLQKEKESENVKPVVLSKELTFIHKYNDTFRKEGTQNAYSKINAVGGLENKIQNWGGVQKTILNNKVQYNFYFWLVPKNFKKNVGSFEDY